MKKRARIRRETTGSRVLAGISEYVLVTLGCAVAAASFDAFMRPLGIASGGVVGLSVIVERAFGIEPAYTQWALNLPLMLVGFLALGGSFGLKTIAGSVLLPLFILLFRGLPGPTDNPLLAAAYAGIGIGLGIGIVFRGRGSVGGFSVLAKLISGRTPLSPSQVLMCFDGAVVVTAGLVMGVEQALYALVVVFAMGKTMDAVLTGLGLSKTALVVSERHEDIGDAILRDLDRGYTRLEAHGGYTDERRPAILCVMDPSEVGRFKSLVFSLDPAAFVVIGEAHEVHGLGFPKRV